jgi:hypothetical protein
MHLSSFEMFLRDMSVVPVSITTQRKREGEVIIKRVREHAR